VNREWTPTAVAGGIAILLVWLAGDPLALRPEDVRPGGPLWWAGPAFLRVPEVRLIEPRGDVPTFPARFRWGSVPGASAYELSVGPDSPGSPPLIRREEIGTQVEVGELSGDASFAAGDFVWEIRARRGGDYVARSVARFRVVSPP
jgi:hypothetical protein